VKRVLITGAAGFTGRYLAPILAQSGYEVHGTVHGELTREVPGVAELHPVDIGDFDAVQRLVTQVAPEKVCHLAAISFVAHSDVAQMYRANVLGTRNLLAAIADTQRKPSAVLLASSANVYGNAREGMLDESTPVAPANDYGVTKAASELLASSYSGKLPLIVVRPFNYTGRGQPERFLIPKIVAHARRGEPEIELGNLDIARDFSDVRAVVDAYARLLEEPQAVGRTFNVSSGHPVRMDEVLKLVTELSGHELRVRVNPQLVRRDEIKTLWGSREKLDSLIGPVPMPALEQTLSWMLEG
jgi:nucleoside-diphosphate-sugar epimerase